MFEGIMSEVQRPRAILMMWALCHVAMTIAAVEVAQPPSQTFFHDDDMTHPMYKRGAPYTRLRFGKKDMWKVSQRSGPSLRLRFGKRSYTDPIEELQSDNDKRGADRNNLRLRFGKREMDDQSLDDFSDMYQDIERRGGQNNLRLRFGKREYDLNEGSMIHALAQRSNPGLRLRFGKREMEDQDNYMEDDLDQADNIQARGGNPGLRLRFGKRGEEELVPGQTESEDHELEQRGGGPSSRLRFGKRYFDDSYLRAIMERRGGRMPSSRLRFGKRDTTEEKDALETEEYHTAQ